MSEQLTPETVVFGRRNGEPDYMEIVLLTHAEQCDLPAALDMMHKDGWITRVAYFGNERPDFTKVFNTRGSK